MTTRAGPPRPMAGALRVLGLSLSLGLVLGVGVDAAAGDDCGSALDARHRQQLRGGGHALAYVALPPPLAVGRHFALDIVVCPRPGAAPPLALRVDADMPAHRHGMNYRPTVRTLGDGRYRAEGLLLHMPGRWRLLFELSLDGRIERLSHELDLE